MSDPSDTRETGPVVVPIVEEFDLSMDEWLATLRRDELIELPESTADLLAAARSESE